MIHSAIIRNIKFRLVQRFISNNGEVWHVDELLAETGALLYPFKDQIKFTCNGAIEGGNLFKIHKSLLAYCKKSNHSLCSYSCTSLAEYLKHYWVQSLSFEMKCDMAKEITFIQSVEKDGYISLKGNEKVYDSIIRLGPKLLDAKYGVEQFIKPNLNVADEKVKMEKSYRAKKLDQNNIVISDLERDFQDFWKSNKLPISLKYGEYFWNYKICTEVYEMIKAQLHSLDLASSNKLRKKYAFHIVLFLSEWFKREYSGNNNENGLMQIGLSSNNSSQIWENANMPAQYLLGSDNMTEWLFSMYVLGGFPLKYISKVGRFDRLFKGIWGIQQDNEADEEAIREIANSFDGNNVVYRQSLLNGSLYHLIMEIVSNEYPIADPDKSIEPYLSFKQLLQDGKKASFESFFSSEWMIYTEDQSEMCECVFRLKIGNKKDNCYIPYSILRHWNIPNYHNLNEFVLGIETGEGEKIGNTIRFSKTGGGEKPFVGWSNSCYLWGEFSESNPSDIRIVLYEVNDLMREQVICIKTFVPSGFFHLFATGRPYEWSTSRSNTAESAILYLPTLFTIDSRNEVGSKIIGNQQWNWVDIYENTNLCNISTGDIFSITVNRGSLGLKFKMEEKTICYNSRNEIKCVSVIDGVECIETLPLLLGYNGIRKIIYYPFEEGEAQKRYRPSDPSISIEYKQIGVDRNYRNWRDADKLKTGKIQLRISVEGYQKIFTCFYLKNSTNTNCIERNLQEKQITFRIDTDMIFSSDLNGCFLDDNQMNQCEFIFQESESSPKQDVVSFCIGTDVSYAEINIYRARECREIYLKNFLIKAYTQSNCNEEIEVPFILSDKFEIRTIDVNGVRRDKLGECIWVKHDLNLINIGDNGMLDEKAAIRYYLYANRDKNRDDKSVDIDLGKGGIDQYEFYRWKMDSKFAPKLLLVTYCRDSETLNIPIEGLQEGELIFQSLKNGIPRHYLKPIYPNFPWMQLENRIYRTNVLINCFEVACMHKVYFGQFYPLRRLMDEPSGLIDFLKSYLLYKGKFSKYDICNLHRFAHEFLFEWMFLPQSIWKRKFNNEELVRICNDLFRTSPFLRGYADKVYFERFIEYYWTLNRLPWWSHFKRSNSLENRLIQCVRGTGKDFSLFHENQVDERIIFLKDIYAQQSLWQKVVDFIQEKNK